MIAIVQRVSRAESRSAPRSWGASTRACFCLSASSAAMARLMRRHRAQAGRPADLPGRTPMDLSLKDANELAWWSVQFTLAGSIRKGNRPSFDRAEDPALAQSLYQSVADRIAADGIRVARGRFAAHMDVELVNDRPSHVHYSNPRGLTPRPLTASSVPSPLPSVFSATGGCRIEPAH